MNYATSKAKLFELRNVAQKRKGCTVFYDLYCDLCKRKGVTPTRAAIEMGLSKSTPTAWKKQGITPQAAQLQKIAKYFGVSVDFLMGSSTDPAQVIWDAARAVSPQKEKPLVNDDEELTEYLEQLRTRPELKMMFQLTKDATKEDVEKAVKVIEAMLGKD